VKACPSCHLDNHDDAVFCVRCGFPLGSATSEAAGAAAAPDRYLAAGTVVDGKYRIERILGEGGMGVVYVARDVHTDTAVVVKSIRFEHADNPEFRQRTLAEGRALARIDHPNVVRLNAVVVEPAGLYLVMQFIDGEALDHMIERHVASRTPMPIPLVLSIFRMVLRGVGAAHAEGLIHRDLKPANILIRKKDGVAKVTDFGIAKVEEDAKAGRGVTKGIIGSVSYMAPEQVRGQRDLDKRVDIYALGIVLFELIMGRAPFDAPSDYELMRMQAESPIPRVSTQRPDAPAFLDDILARACAKDREQRFASTDEFLAALDAAETRASGSAAGQTVHVRVATEIPPAPLVSAAPPGSSVGVTGEGASLPSAPAPKPPRRRASWLWSSAIVLVTLGGGSTVYWLSGASNSGTDTVLALDAGHRATATDEPTEASTPQAPSPLVGHWRSASGRDFDAVAVGDGVEFRIEKASQHPRQGYEDGDVRFKLLSVDGPKDEFTVEDHLRPTPPAGLEYDPKTSRESCMGVWTTVKGKKLAARFDGAGSLSVDLVQIQTKAEKFKTLGKRVVSCLDLATVPADPIASQLSRVP